MRAAIRNWHPPKQENRTAACALPADQYGQCRGPPRRIGISRRTGGTAHAAERGPARDGVAIAGHRTSGRHEGGGGASGERVFAFDLNMARGAGSRAIWDTVALLSIDTLTLIPLLFRPQLWPVILIDELE